MSEVRTIIDVDDRFLETLSKLSGQTVRSILYQLNDIAMELGVKVLSPDHGNNWTSKKFTMPGLPFNVSAKAKCKWYNGKKYGDVHCTFDMLRGKTKEYNCQDLYNEMVETNLQLRS